MKNLSESNISLYIWFENVPLKSPNYSNRINLNRNINTQRFIYTIHRAPISLARASKVYAATAAVSPLRCASADLPRVRARYIYFFLPVYLCPHAAHANALNHRAVWLLYVYAHFSRESPRVRTRGGGVSGFAFTRACGFASFYLFLSFFGC